jgi:hypothetical protein
VSSALRYLKSGSKIDLNIYERRHQKNNATATKANTSHSASNARFTA